MSAKITFALNFNLYNKKEKGRTVIKFENFFAIMYQ